MYKTRSINSLRFLEEEQPVSIDSLSDLGGNDIITISSDDELKPDLRILIVEDNPINQALLKHQLSSMGFQCAVASDGFHGIDLVDRGEFDLIITDIQMPNMDGRKMLAELRQSKVNNTSSLPIIAATANAMQIDINEYLAEGFDAVLAKPVSINQLKETLAKFLHIEENCH